MVIVEADDVPRLWGEARKWLLPAIEQSGRFTEAAVLSWLLADPASWRLWLHENAALVTRIVVFPKMRVCEIYFAGGKDLKTWEIFEPVICSWAKNMKCSAIEEVGRTGWERVAHPGWKKTATRMTKEL